jgi:hypothetical protein
MAGTCAVFVIFTLGYMLFVVPVREEIFLDFGVALPGLTAGIIRFSRDIRLDNPGQVFSLGWVAIGVATLIGAGLTVLSAFVPRVFARALLAGVMLLMVVWMGLCTWAMLGPTLEMQRSLQVGGV